MTITKLSIAGTIAAKYPNAKASDLIATINTLSRESETQVIDRTSEEQASISRVVASK